MSSLGFQTVYRLFNELDDVVCERVFLPPKQELARAARRRARRCVTLESQTPVRDFDVLAFSVSFEWDYTNVVSMLRLAGVPARAEARTSHDPLVVIGGAVTFVNPEPLAPVRRRDRRRRRGGADSRADAALREPTDRDDLYSHGSRPSAASTSRRSTTSATTPTARSRRSSRGRAPARRRS